jgi:hypothetical protein
MPERQYGAVEVFGPFWRAANSRTQDSAGMRLIIGSSELWGRAPAHSSIPAVQGYLGALPHGKKGFEFYALTPPDAGFGYLVYWRERADESVRVEEDVAKVRIMLSRVDQDY